MPKSNFRIGSDIIEIIKLGIKDTIAFLGNTKMYPLSKPIDDAIVTCDSATYNGSNQVAQNISVTLSGATLVENTDYTVTSNTGGTNAGSYSVTVSGTGNYEGSAEGTFTINKANSSLSFAVTNITVGVGDIKTNQVTVNAGDGTVTYSSNNTTAVTVNNSGVISGVGVGNATITANISQTTNYNAASASYTASCSIAVTAKFNITSTSSPTRIASATTNFSAVEIDGIEQPSVVSAYTFSTTGEHTVKYTLIDPTSIGGYAFNECSGLTSVTIPNSVTSIGERAFQACTSLTSITIPNSVTSIGDYAFQGCNSLSTITIPNSVTSIGANAFQYTSWYSSYSANTDNIYDNVVYVNNIAYQVVNKTITEVTFRNDTTNITNQLFYECRSLTSVTIPDSVTSIGYSAFLNCTGLTSCTIGSGVTSIGNDAFRNCTSLTSIEIPNGVTSIGNEAFNNCTGLTSITSNATTAPTIAYGVFVDVKKGGTLYVPIGSSGYDTWMKNEYGYLGYRNWTKVEQ